jgi:hypothetical protein
MNELSLAFLARELRILGKDTLSQERSGHAEIGGDKSGNRYNLHIDSRQILEKLAGLKCFRS